MSGHIRNYASVAKAVDAEYREAVRKAEEDLAKGVGNADALRELLAKPRFRGGRTVCPKGSLVAAWKRTADRLEAADGVGRVREIECKVTWRKSRTWGWCPKCETRVWYDGEPRDVVRNRDGKPCEDCRGNPVPVSMHFAVTGASGYGYDKLSAAVSGGLRCPAVDRLIIENRRCWDCYGVTRTWGLPRLDVSGKGVSVLRDLFVQWEGPKAPIPGFEWTWEEGEHWCLIRARRKRRRAAK